MPDDFSIEIDLATARDAAEAARELLQALRRRHDLSRWEYTRAVRIAPLEIPHSHPVLTLNGRTAQGPGQDEDAFLATYLHEQIHWGLSLHRERETSAAVDALMALYPDAHTGLPETAGDSYSTYLHLAVNWLEIDAVAAVIGRERAEAAALHCPVYTAIYRTVIADRARIESVLTTCGVLPLPPADGRD